MSQFNDRRRVHDRRPSRPGRGRGEDGFALAMTVLLLLPILAMASVAVDLGAWYSRADHLQRAGDAAALAAAPLLPDLTKARAAALTTLSKNGISCTGRVTCTTGRVPGSSSRFQVTLRDDSVVQFFSKALRNSVSIERSATAERIRPVPMGSPRNHLGTGTELSGAARENLLVSVSGYCAKNEHGDRLTPRADANGSGSNHSCVPGSPSYVRSNSEYTADGYFYAIEFPEDVSGGYKLDVRDAPHCQGAGSAQDSGADTDSARQYDFVVRANDNNDPAAATPILTRRLSPADCGGWANQWRTLHTFVSPRAGTYYLQVKPVIPTNRSGPDSAEGQNQFGIRVAQPSGFVPCTNDSTTAGAGSAYVANCPEVYALSHLGVYAAFSGANPSFFLASVGSEHANKTMEVELFDPAEGATAIELLDPNGNPATFVWEIACKDGTYRSEGTGTCTTGEAAPTGGYGDLSGTSVAVGGTGTQPWTQLTQDGKYSDRMLRLKVKLPANYAALYGSGAGARTWWKIRYSVCSGSGCSLGDRTTWSVRIKGDPVRLVPN